MKAIVMLCMLFAVYAPSLAQQADDSRVSRALNASVSTLKVLTALPGEKLGDTAAGKPVNMSSLSEQQRNAILDAARMMLVPQEYDRKFGGQCGSDDLVPMIFSEFTVTLTGGALGPESTIPLYPTWNLPGNGATPTISKTDDAPVVADAPSLESILAAAPTDTAARANYLRTRALEILEPLGVYRLNKANVPVDVRRFTSSEKVKLAELSERDQAWLESVYTAFCVKAAELGERYRVTGVTGTSTIGGIPAEWLSKFPPLWADLGNPTVEFTVHYIVAIAPSADQNCGCGGGWALPKYSVPEN